jgi:DNA-directed RNA polymerase subunit N (RpoN/RPB10)
MIIPIRCFSCGKPVAHLWEKYAVKIRKRKPERVLDELGLKRQCCRALFLSNIDMMRVVSKYRK